MANNQAVSFDDLPPEISNLVYGLVLQLDEPIVLECHRPKSLRIKKPRGPYGEKVFQDTEHRANVSLLRVNHRVNAEAAPILYGANTYVFRCQYGYGSEAKLFSFLTMIGDSKKHLRSIEMDRCYNAVMIRSAFHLLKQATQLESFEISRDMMHELVHKRNHLQALQPWFKALRKNAADMKAHKGALGIFKVNLPTEPLYLTSPGKQLFVEWRENRVKLMARLAKALA